MRRSEVELKMMRNSTVPREAGRLINPEHLAEELLDDLEDFTKVEVQKYDIGASRVWLVVNTRDLRSKNV